jgi:hypothetical protein
MKPIYYVRTDYGKMAVHPRNKKSTWATLERIAKRRYLRGEDLSMLSTSIMTEPERIGERKGGLTRPARRVRMGRS